MCPVDPIERRSRVSAAASVRSAPTPAHRLVLTAALALQACVNQSDSPPANCAVAKAQFQQCFDRHGAGDADKFEEMWYACVPHSEPKTIEGSWATDFEWNAFFEGRQPTPEEAFPDTLPPSLAFQTGVDAPHREDGAARLWKMKFVGREETCRLFDDIPPTFFVEKVLDKDLIWEVEGYPTYSLEPVPR